MKPINKMKDIAQNAIREINWENYKKDEGVGYWKLGQVFFCQLEWVKENIPLSDDTEELHDYINEIQKACEVFNILDDLIDQDNQQ